MSELRAADFPSLSIAELRARFEEAGEELPHGGKKALEEDPRAGVREIAARLEKRKAAVRAEERRLDKLSQFEVPLWESGIELVGGVDEVGMAPLAGPVIAAAVILPRNARLTGVNDSKQLTPEEREELAPRIQALAVSWAIGRAEVHEIDSVNIYQAGLLALRRAGAGL